MISNASFSSTTDESLISSSSHGDDQLPKSYSTESFLGFYDDLDEKCGETEDGQAKKERDLWNRLVSEIMARKGSYRNQKADDVITLHLWFHPTPSQGLMQSSSHGAENSMDLSCCVTGFRICQFKKTGEIKAQYNFVFCYGSKTYTSWRCYSEFTELASIVTYMNENVNRRCFQNSTKLWNYIESRRQLFRNLSVTYLMEKSMRLGTFMENVMFESPNPALLMYFAQSDNFSA
jgi:hypothetical protein